ncbi:RebB family R body protein [Rheinheimera marina]|uniref:RebB family R body protein n=1 Tax=Rheinheimera marina TaxID=1774958 RepID=A0ABV9JPJ7_9GAMM
MSELNAAIVQSLALVNTMTLGVAPAMAMGSQYQHLAYSLGLASMNQVFAQQQTNISQQASSVLAVLQLYRR